MRARLLLLAALTAQLSLPAAADDESVAGAVQVAGCEEFTFDGTCELGGERTLSVWAGDEAGTIAVRIDGRAHRAALTRPPTGGVTARLQVPAGADRLVVLDEDGRRLLELALRERRRSEAALKADRLLAEGDLAGATAAVRAALPQAGAAERGELLRTRGRVFLRRGERIAAEGTLAEAIRASREGGYRYNAVLAGNALAFSLMHGARAFGAARSLIEGFPADSGGHAESRYFRHQDLGLIAFNAGDARTALREFTSAATLARSVDLLRFALNSESLLAIQLQRLGRRQEATQTLEAWRGALPEDLPGCERALYYTNLGWSRLLALDAGDEAPDPGDDLTTALALTDRYCNANERSNARINLALAHFHAGRLEEASAALADARAQTATPETGLVLWSDDIAARIALAQGRHDIALALFSRLEEAASATLSSSALWRARTGRARVLAATGNPDAAIDAYQAAEEQLDTRLLQVPLDSGRETLLAARARAERHHLTLLLDTGRDDDAFALARRSHSRALRALHLPDRLAALDGEARRSWDGAISRYRTLVDELGTAQPDAWMLPADELARQAQKREAVSRSLRSILDDALAAVGTLPDEQLPSDSGPGEVHLQVAPLTVGEALFVRSMDGLSVHRPDCRESDHSERATCALRAVLPQIRQAGLVRIAVAGPMSAVDFHALAADGQPLAAHTAVVYSAGLPPAEPASREQGRALLVADPRNDLREARAEIETVHKLLRASGLWSADLLAGDVADAATVAGRLGDSDLFHYAGHARFAGPSGWQSELALAGGSRLDAADILALGRAPATVVLSGCETALGRDARTSQPFSLAHAFLAGGAGGVIATSRPVADRSAHRLVGDFYRGWTAGLPRHIAFNKAQQKLRTEHADPDWAAFRLLEP